MSDTPRLQLRFLGPKFAVCRLDPDRDPPDTLDFEPFFSLTRTADEVSLVCRESTELPGRVEPGWRCLAVAGPLAFDQVGILASLTQPLADAGVSVFAISTYDTDYLLVKQEQLELAIAALRGAGHEVAR